MPHGDHGRVGKHGTLKALTPWSSALLFPMCPWSSLHLRAPSRKKYSQSREALMEEEAEKNGASAGWGQVST
jgi:hypothetical protein